jgi:AP2 domain.
LKKIDKRIDTGQLVGQRFGRLTVLSFIGYKGGSKYICRCDCGKEVVVPRKQLLNGRSKTCGDCSKIVSEGDYYRYYCTNGDSFIFDKCDLDLIKKHRWYMSHGYAACRISGKNIRLTHLIMIPPTNMYVDHINHNPRDNRRENLRGASYVDNQRNMSLPKHNSSGYKGVGYRKDRCRYRAYISIQNKTKHIGYYDTAVEAARAYDEAARFYFGEFACLNFPKEDEQGCLLQI